MHMNPLDYELIPERRAINGTWLDEAWNWIWNGKFKFWFLFLSGTYGCFLFFSLFICFIAICVFGFLIAKGFGVSAEDAIGTSVALIADDQEEIDEIEEEKHERRKHYKNGMGNFCTGVVLLCVQACLMPIPLGITQIIAVMLLLVGIIYFIVGLVKMCG